MLNEFGGGYDGSQAKVSGGAENNPEASVETKRSQVKEALIKFKEDLQSLDKRNKEFEPTGTAILETISVPEEKRPKAPRSYEMIFPELDRMIDAIDQPGSDPDEVFKEFEALTEKM